MSFAQNGEDVRLWRAFSDRDSGFYVEVGGWDPQVDSASRLFYGRGWSGIVLEPVAEKAEPYALARPRDQVVQALAGARPGEARFYVFPDTGLSTTVAEHAQRHKEAGWICIERELPVVTLDSVLDEAGAGEIHFMLIDVEGAEKEVLTGLDLHRHRPWLLVVEATLPNSTTQSYESWDDMITSQDYAFAAFDGLNRYYVSTEHAELAERISLPPNVHDGFVSLPEYQYRLASQAFRAEADAAGRERDLALVRVELLAAQLAAARRWRDEAVQEAEAARHQVAQLRAAASQREAELQAALADRAQQCEDLAARNAQTQEELQRLQGSRSWRVTAPLRRLTGER